MTDQTTDRHTCHNQKAAAGPAWQCPRCSATPAVPPSPVVQSPIREQLLNSIDATFCQSLGFGTPEALLAAYEASRTQTVDQAALRDHAAEALAKSMHPDLASEVPPVDHPFWQTYRRHADAVLAAVLPATTNHDTDTSDWSALAERTGRLRKTTKELVDRTEELETKVTQLAADQAASLREAADRLPDADLPFVSPMGRQQTADWLRRVADKTAATETAHQPCRGDQFEAWLKQQRDACFGQASSWAAVDGLLDQYRLHAETGTPLSEHVCEGRVVGDCECLEQPAAGARQDGAQS